MALILGVTNKSVFYIGDTPVKVVSTEGYEKIVVEVEGKQFTITDKERLEIYPDVLVSSGKPTGKAENFLPRLVIDAPKEIVILRQELYERQDR